MLVNDAALLTLIRESAQVSENDLDDTLRALGLARATGESQDLLDSFVRRRLISALDAERMLNGSGRLAVAAPGTPRLTPSGRVPPPNMVIPMDTSSGLDLLESEPDVQHPDPPTVAIEPQEATAPFPLRSQRDPSVAPPPSTPADAPRAPIEYGPDKQNRFGRFLLLEEVAKGGVGVVFRALQTDLKREVALKLLKAGHLASERERQRFIKEAQSIARLNHPGIVRVYEAGEVEGLHYIAMEFVHGTTLDALMKRRRFTQGDALRLVQRIAQALEHAHQAGVIHRDIKPSNVLVDTTGVPRLTDFGLAQDLEEGDAERLTRSGTMLGTLFYMSPEQARGASKHVDGRTDLFSLGVILYEILSGKLPFEGASTVDVLNKLLESDPLPPRELNARISKDAETICLKTLEKDPQRRYPSATALAEDIGRLLDGEAILARPPGLVGRWARRLKRRWPLWAAALSLLLGAGGWGAWEGIARYRHRLALDQVERGITALKEGLTDDGIAALREGIASGGASARAYRHLAEALAAQNLAAQRGPARDLIAQALKLDPEDFPSHELGLKLALEGGAERDLSAAHAHIDALLKARPQERGPRLERVRLLAEAGRHDEARPEIEILLAQSPSVESDPEVLLLASRNYLHHGESDKVVALLNRALEHIKNEARLYLLRAEAHERLGGTAEARQDDTFALELEHENREALYQRARLAFAEGLITLTQKDIAALIDLKDERPEVQLLLGRLKEHQGEFRDALPAYRKATGLLEAARLELHLLRFLGQARKATTRGEEFRRAFPDDAGLTLEVALAHLELRQYARAQELLSELAKHPDATLANAARKALADYLHISGEHNAAMIHLETVAAADENDLDVHSLRGRCLQDLGLGLQSHEAYKKHQRNWQLSQRTKLPFLAQARDASNRRDHTLAAAYLQRLCFEYPYVAALHLMRGATLWKDERRAEAEAAFRRAIEVGPYDPEAYLNLGEFLRKHLPRGGNAPAEKLDEIEGLFKKAQEIAPRDATPLICLALVTRERGDIKAAIAILDQAEKLDPKERNIFVLRAQWHRELGAQEQADQDRVKADEARYQHDVTAREHYQRAMRLYQEGTQIEQAISALSEAIKLDPKFAEAVLLRAKLLGLQFEYLRSLRDFALATRLEANHVYRLYQQILALKGAVPLEHLEGLLRKAAKEEPQDGDLQFLLGILAMARSEFEQAQDADLEQGVQALDRCTAQHASFVPAWSMLGYLQFKRRKYLEAHQAFAQARKLRRDFALTDYFEARYYATRHNYPFAIGALKKAIELDGQQNLQFFNRSLLTVKDLQNLQENKEFVEILEKFPP